MVGDSDENLTMWSESLMESLYVALRKQKSDEMLKQILGELKAKGYNGKYLMKRAKERIGPRAETRIAELLGYGGESKEKKESSPELSASKGTRAGTVSRPVRKVRARQMRWSERARHRTPGVRIEVGFFAWLRSLFSR